MNDNAKRTESTRHFSTAKRVIVTGGAGFLGRVIVNKLKERGADEIIVPRSANYDLTKLKAIKQLLANSRSEDGAPVDMIIHLAARVDGIEANRLNPATFFYDNLMMSAQLMHESYKAEVAKFVAIGTVCAYPKFTPIPFREDDLRNGYWMGWEHTPPQSIWKGR